MSGLLLVTASFSGLHASPARAGTCGTPCNADTYEAGDNLSTPWYSGTHTVSQRYGCTLVQEEPDVAPSGWCPP